MKICGFTNIVCLILLGLALLVTGRRAAKRMKRDDAIEPSSESPATETTTASTESEVSTTTTSTTTTTATTTTTRTTTTNAGILLQPPVNGTINFTQIVHLLGPRKKVDIIFILSRSQSVGKRAFYEKSRFVMRSLLQLYATIHANYTRVAAISYTDNYTVDYDDISGDNNNVPRDKCQLFPTTNQNFPLDVLKYREDDKVGSCGIIKAYNAAADIFRKGKLMRPDVAQIAVLLSDVVGSCRVETLTLNLNEVKTFGVGVGPFLNQVAMQSYVTKYQEYAAPVDSWLEITERANPPNRFNPPLYVEITENISCGANGSQKCFCNIDDGIIKACTSELECAAVSSAPPKCGNSCQYGSCLEVSYGFLCQCRENFYGQYCQSYSSPCRFPDICMVPNGQCTGDPTSGGQFKCNCTSAYEGDFCENLKPTTATTPPPRNVTLIFTIVRSVTPVPFDPKISIILGSVFGGLALLAIIVGIILCAVYYIRRRKVLKHNHSYKSSSKSTIGIQSTITSLAGASTVGRVSSRLSHLFGNRRSGEGFPSVPNRFSASLSALDMQNVSHEETLYCNEVIQDNRQMLKNWKSYLDDLVNKQILEKAVMVNTSTKESVNTEKWIMDWNELAILESNFGQEAEVNVQGDDFLPRASGDDFMSGKELFASGGGQKFVCMGRTKKYFIVGIGNALDGMEECNREIQYIVKHIKAEGF